MHLDTLTLIAAGSFVTALSGLLLLGAWTQMRSAPALLWWAAADFVLTGGLSLLTYGGATETVWAAAIGGVLSSVSPALVWAGTRIFTYRAVRALPLVAGTAVCVAVGALSPVETTQSLTAVAGFGVWIVYLLAASWELWRSRVEFLKARWPLIALLSLHALIFAAGIYDVIGQEMPVNAAPPLDSWFGLIHFEALIYAIATALFMIVMCKERLELGYIKAAESDALTGIANRGAFFAAAELLLAQSRTNGAPLSVIVFDLDGFKLVNDTYGHAVGDKLLNRFVETAKSVLRPRDFFGRHGGEEFAVVLPGATVETAYAIAERVRCAFAEASRAFEGLKLYATVSAGVAAASPSATFDAAMEVADRALYRAKSRGRNRVERADRDRPEESTIIRVA